MPAPKAFGAMVGVATACDFGFTMFANKIFYCARE